MTRAAWLTIPVMVGGLLTAVATSPGSAAGLHAAKPGLSAAPSPSQNPWVVGKHWPAHLSLAITVHYFDLVARTRTSTGKTGTFGVEIRDARWCGRLAVDARDTRGHHVRLHGASTGTCIAPNAGDHLSLHVLTAREMRYQEIVVDTRHLQTEYTMHVGDTLWLYEQGTDELFMIPSVQKGGLQAVGQGTVPACAANSQCLFDAGFYWRYQADSPGDIYIVLSARCRQSKPPCMLPDRVIRVHILP